MDLQKYEEALDNISETIVPTYFKGDNSKYDKAKTKMMEKFELIQNEDMFDSLPFFIPYFRRNFLFFCQNKQNFVGTILHSVANITFSNFKNYLVSITRLFYITDPDEKLIIAENSYQAIHNEILKIIDSPKILKRNIHEVLNLVRSLSTVTYNFDIRVIYILLLNELSYSLQILYNIEDLDRMAPPDRIVINEYSGILNELGNLNKRDYSRYPIVQIFIKDLEIIYNRIEEFHSKPEPQDRVSDSGTVTTKQKTGKTVSDSVIKIKMNPFPGKKSNNVITINNKQIDNVQNSPFDLLYYLLWLQKNYPDKKAALKIDDIIPDEHIKAITENDEQLNRFRYSWNDINNIRFKNEKSKTVNKVNTILKRQLGIYFDAVVENASKYYVLTNRFKSDNIELIPYKTNI